MTSTTDPTDVWTSIGLDGTDIIAAGTDGTDALIGRFTSAGVPDGSFNGGTPLSVDLGGPEDAAHSLVVLADGSVVVGGASLDSSADTGDLAFAKVDSTGSLVSSFDSDGVATFDHGPVDNVSDLAVQSDGSIVAAAWSTDTLYGGSGDWLVLRLDPATGALDPDLRGQRHHDSRLGRGR